MGLSPSPARPGFATAVAPAATGIIDPSTGKPVGATDPYFLEVSFLFPWAAAFGHLGLYGFWSMMMFLGVLTIGFIYEWKKGALEWD